MRTLDGAVIAKPGLRYLDFLQAADGVTAIFTHAATADRTYTLPDADTTLGPTPTRSTQDVATSESTSSTSYTDLATSGPAVTLTPGRTADQLILLAAEISNNTVDTEGRMSVAIAGAGASDADAVLATWTGAGPGFRSSAHVLATSVANGSTHTAKYKANATSTFSRRRLSAFTLS